MGQEEHALVIMGWGLAGNLRTLTSFAASEVGGKSTRQELTHTEREAAALILRVTTGHGGMGTRDSHRDLQILRHQL